MRTNCFWSISALIVALQLAIFCTTGCALFKPSDPDDLRFVSVVVEPAERVNPAGGIDKNQPDDSLKITISSSVNLMKFMSGNYDYIYHDIAPCADWREARTTGASRFWGDRDIFWHGVPIDAYTKTAILPESGGQLYHYDIKIEVSDRHVPKPRGGSYGNSAYRLPYDLSAEPQDICLLVHGSQYFGPTFETNTVKIPRDAIIKAFQTAQQNRIGNAERR